MANVDEEKLKQYVEQTEQSIPVPATSGLIDTSAIQKPWVKEEPAIGNRIGWQPIKSSELPTKGIFYPADTQFAIRSASVAEIKHWSTLNDMDISAIDDMLNYVIERCVTIKTGNPFSSWKDIKEVDRFYLLLAIRELSFIKGENQLQVKLSETKKINVTKEMIDYINIEGKLMDYYDETLRCFVLKFKSGRELKIDIPSVGITSFLKNYILRKKQAQESFDEDFINYAPFVIREWRGLNDTTYRQYVMDSEAWDKAQISMLYQIRQMLMDTVDPMIKYLDEGGMERTAPLNFQGGIKSVLLVSDPFAELA
jgi:hypothetical protein